MSEEHWESLAEHVQRRRSELGLTQAQVQDAGGPSTAKLREIENQRTTTLSPSKRRDLERALGWAFGSVDQILEGQEPTNLRPIPIRMPHSDAKQSIIDAEERSAHRARLNADDERRLQLEIYKGITDGWLLADTARKLGCSEESVTEFINSGFGLLLNSGTLSLLAHNPDAIAELMDKFRQADTPRSND